ncbi:BspA family leucine-rich repeat surface protein [Mycoplasma mycoides]|uniref:BspA family leucine-rich repeat surface protein n=1 Tax=Mycoplasma mycoides TaxID=2102 RepID=UPI0022407822|nr:BspA family leucine-rich repeat surface protein [Mycoplasma mycoides]QVK05850.1 BspA family leucine-rich repeat surface protein [Mycoplasma mycoides subsp. capri]
MKKLLPIFMSFNTAFLVTSTILMVTHYNEDHKINYNAISWIKKHKTSGDRLTDIGYYKSGNNYIIQQIPPNVSVIAAELPEQITSLRNAFYGSKQRIRWEKQWDTKNITDMSATFYDAIWFDDASIKNWNTSKVTDMSRMFHKAKSFNQDLSNWNVSNVKNFQSMFEEANRFNNGDKPLNWGEKLKSANNMSKMFKNTPEFKQNLNSWLMTTEVDKNDFGLDSSLHPKWYAKPQSQPPTTSSSIPNNFNNLPRSDNSNSPTSIDNNVTPDSETSIIKPNTPAVQPEKDNKIYVEDKIENPKIDNNSYKIPAKSNTIIKSNSPSAGIIAGVVLGSFTILGIGVGTGYYYRKNLKNFYLNSASKTKNLYFKSKEKIKDKLSKIKSKK